MTSAILSDLARAKAVFQLRTVVAYIRGNPLDDAWEQSAHGDHPFIPAGLPCAERTPPQIADTPFGLCCGGEVFSRISAAAPVEPRELVTNEERK